MNQKRGDWLGKHYCNHNHVCWRRKYGPVLSQNGWLSAGPLLMSKVQSAHFVLMEEWTGVFGKNSAFLCRKNWGK